MTRWPTIQQDQRAHKDTLEDFFRINYYVMPKKLLSASMP